MPGHGAVKRVRIQQLIEGYILAFPYGSSDDIHPVELQIVKWIRDQLIP